MIFPLVLRCFLKNFSKNAVTVNYDMGNSAFWEFEAKQEFFETERSERTKQFLDKILHE